MYPSRSGRAFNTSKIRPHECTEKHLSETSVPLKLKAISTRCYKQAIRFRQRANTIRSGEWHLLRLTFLFTHWVLTYIHSLPAIKRKQNKQTKNHQPTLVYWDTCTRLIFWWTSCLSKLTPSTATPAQEGDGVLTAGVQGCPLSLPLSPVPRAVSAPRLGRHSLITSHPALPDLHSDLCPAGSEGAFRRHNSCF